MSGHNKVVCSSRENFTKKINGSRVRADGTDGTGGTFALTDLCSSVNPIPTSGVDYAPQVTNPLPSDFKDLPPALWIEGAC